MIRACESSCQSVQTPSSVVMQRIDTRPMHPGVGIDLSLGLIEEDLGPPVALQVAWRHRG